MNQYREEEFFTVLPATPMQRMRYKIKNIICAGYLLERLKNSYALRKKQGIYAYIQKRINVFLRLPTLKGEYCFIIHPAWIRGMLKHPRLGQGEFFGEGRQLWVIADALGRYRMSKERQDAKQKRNILAHLLSDSARYVPKMQEVSRTLVQKWSHQANTNFFINYDLQEFTVAIYLKTVMNFSGSTSGIASLLEKQIDFLGQRLVYKKIPDFHIQFKQLRDELVARIGSDEGLLKTTEYTERLSEYIDEHYKSLQADAFATGLNGALLAGYMAPYPAFIALIYEIGQNPEYQERLWNEKQEIGENFVDYIKRENTLLHACVHEVLRLHPSQPFIFRSTTQDVLINGHFVKKNSELVADVYHVLRDSTLWGNSPETFYPERFIENEERYRYPFLVYSSGPNNCTGQIFSRFSLKVLLAELITELRWQVTNGKIEHHFHFALAMNQEVAIKVTKV